MTLQLQRWHNSKHEEETGSISCPYRSRCHAPSGLIQRVCRQQKSEPRAESACGTAGRARLQQRRAHGDSRRAPRQHGRPRIPERPSCRARRGRRLLRRRSRMPLRRFLRRSLRRRCRGHVAAGIRWLWGSWLWVRAAALRHGQQLRLQRAHLRTEPQDTFRGSMTSSCDLHRCSSSNCKTCICSPEHMTNLTPPSRAAAACACKASLLSAACMHALHSSASLPTGCVIMHQPNNRFPTHSSCVHRRIQGIRRCSIRSSARLVNVQKRARRGLQRG